MQSFLTNTFYSNTAISTTHFSGSRPRLYVYSGVILWLNAGMDKFLLVREFRNYHRQKHTRQRSVSANGKRDHRMWREEQTDRHTHHNTAVAFWGGRLSKDIS